MKTVNTMRDHEEDAFVAEVQNSRLPAAIEQMASDIVVRYNSHDDLIRLLEKIKPLCPHEVQEKIGIALSNVRLNKLTA